MTTNFLAIATFTLITNWTDISVTVDPSCPTNAIPNRFVVQQRLTVISNVLYTIHHNGRAAWLDEIFPITLTNAPTRTITNTVPASPVPWWNDRFLTTPASTQRPLTTNSIIFTTEEGTPFPLIRSNGVDRVLQLDGSYVAIATNDAHVYAPATNVTMDATDGTNRMAKFDDGYSAFSVVNTNRSLAFDVLATGTEWIPIKPNDVLSIELNDLQHRVHGMIALQILHLIVFGFLVLFVWAQVIRRACR